MAMVFCGDRGIFLFHVAFTPLSVRAIRSRRHQRIAQPVALKVIRLGDCRNRVSFLQVCMPLSNTAEVEKAVGFGGFPLMVLTALADGRF